MRNVRYQKVISLVLVPLVLSMAVLCAGCSGEQFQAANGGKGRERKADPTADVWVLTAEEQLEGGEFSHTTLVEGEYDVNTRTVSLTQTRDGDLQEEHETTYGQDGNISSERISYFMSGELDHITQRSYTSYDSMGDYLHFDEVVKDADGNVTDTLTYDAKKDSNGNVVSESYVSEDGEVIFENERTFDQEGNLLTYRQERDKSDGSRTIIEDYHEYEDGKCVLDMNYVDGEFVNGLSHDWTDSNSETIIYVNEDGEKTSSWETKIYDKKGRLIGHQLNSGNSVWEYAYDENDNVIEKVLWDRSYGSKAMQIVVYEYDADGNLVNSIDSHFEDGTYVYDNRATYTYANLVSGKQSSGMSLDDLVPPLEAKLVAGAKSAAVNGETAPPEAEENDGEANLDLPVPPTSAIGKSLTFSHGEYAINLSSTPLAENKSLSFDADMDAILCGDTYVMFFNSDESARSAMGNIMYYSDEGTFTPSYGGVVSLFGMEDYYHMALVQTGASYQPIDFLGADAAEPLTSEGAGEDAALWRSIMCSCCGLPEDTDSDTINTEFAKAIVERITN